jgi:3,4-dihydroxy 2-butanone 4-phosphate synthase/GTP cyclohydrolase II
LFTYQDRNDGNVHLALVMGNVAGDEPVLARVHARNLIDDLFSSKRSDCTIPVREAMKKIAAAGRGVLVIIRENENNKALVELVHGYQMQDNGIKNPSSLNNALDWRTTGTGSRILSDLGVHRLKVMGAQKKYIGLSGFDLEVVEHVDPDAKHQLGVVEA